MSDSSKPIASEADSSGQTPLKRVLSECKSAFFFMGLVSFGINLMGVVPTLYMMNMYDRVLTSKSGITMVSLLVLVIGLYLFWSALEWIRNRIMIRISLRLDWDLAAKAFDASFRRNAGRRQVNVQQVMGDLLTLRQFLTGRPIVSLIDAPFSVFYIIIGGIIHPFLAAFTLVITFVVTGLALLNRQLTTPALRAANEANAEASRVAAQSLRYCETALAMGMMPALRKRWHSRHRWFLQNQVNGSEASGVINWMGSVVGKLTPSIQMSIGVLLAIQGVITGGMVIAATFLIHRAVAPLRSLISNWKDIVAARLAFERLDALMAEEEARHARMSLPAPTGRLEVSALTGIPPGGKTAVIRDVSFTLEPGRSIAIVGPNGAGKSSLLRLLLGLWKPASGSVRLDSVEISEWDHDELGPYVGFVPQEAELFEATVAENIARLGPVDSEKVVAAAQAVGIHDMILRLPQGYDTPLGDSGFQLSGGQAQRVSIARALYGNPRILILDEPNAKLDADAENQLLNLLKSLQGRGVTIVLTTHKPRVIGVADLVLILKDGEQVAVGSAKEYTERHNEIRRQQTSQQASRLTAVTQHPATPGSAVRANARPAGKPLSSELAVGEGDQA